MSSAPDTLLELPPLPPGITTLTNDETHELESEHTNLPQTLVHCITCRGQKRFVWWADSERTTTGVYRCPCDDQYVAHRYFLRSGIGLNYQRLCWNDLQVVDENRDRLLDEYREDAEAYVASGTGILMTGTPATGKSLVATLIVKELLGNGLSCRMMSTAKLISSYMSTWDKEQSQLAHMRLKRDVLNVDVLLLDDLGREWRSNASGAQDKNARTTGQTALEEIFRYRVQNDLPTFITTNHDLDTLREAYPGHLTNVIDECSQVIEFTGEYERSNVHRRKSAEVKAGITRPIFY